MLDVFKATNTEIQALGDQMGALLREVTLPGSADISTATRPDIATELAPNDTFADVDRKGIDLTSVLSTSTGLPIGGDVVRTPDVQAYYDNAVEVIAEAA